MLIEWVLAWLGTVVVAALPLMASGLWLSRRGCVNPTLMLVVPIAVSCALGYATFWAFLASPTIGRMFVGATSIGAVAAIGYWLWFGRRKVLLPLLHAWQTPGLLMLGVGFFYLGLLYLPALDKSADAQSSVRFTHPLPPDAVIPELFAERLAKGEPIRPFLGDWLSSDRPPLQTGFYLQVQTALAPLHSEPGLVYQCLGTWLQLYWIPAVWLLGWRLGLGERRRAIVVGLIAMSGFALVNSVYVWPKLLAGGLGLITSILLLDERTARRPLMVGLAAVIAAWAWLAHGGVAFSFLAVALMLVLRPATWRRWSFGLLGAVLFLTCITPWIIYQKTIDPPGNRLLKWHLAGVIAPDQRGVGESLRDAYATLTTDAWLKAKAKNFRVMFSGDFHTLVAVCGSPLKNRRQDEFFFIFRAVGVLNLAWLGLWMVRRRWSSAAWTLFTRLTASAGLTLLVWALLMFEPGSTVLHQGSYTALLILFAATATLLCRLPAPLFLSLGLWQTAYFGATWLPYYGSAPLRWDMALVATSGAALVVFAVLRRPKRRAAAKEAHQPISPDQSLAPKAPSRFVKAAVMLGTLALVALVLFGRKPEMFFRPQFWAEDATVFFLQAHDSGWRAIFIPYSGYYHAVPRLIALLCSGFDPAHIPRLYFIASLLSSLAMAAAIFSPRLDLPCRPLLALAIVLVPHTGEVWLTITNLQWVLAPGLLLLLLARDPVTPAQWTFDVIALLVLALTGPFVAIWLPLFLWRVWQRRSAASLCLAVLAALAALAQLSAYLQSVRHASGGPFLLEQLMRLPGLRVWGSLLAPASWADKLSVAAGIAAAFAGWIALSCGVLTEPKYKEAGRLLLTAAGLLILSTFYKFKGELLVLGSIGNGDRYFYIPKLLVWWLLVLLSTSPVLWKRSVAVGLLALSLAISLSGYRAEPMVDHDWPAYAARIRAGEAVTAPINPAGWAVHVSARPMP
jgi:hypothetical protein